MIQNLVVDVIRVQDESARCFNLYPGRLEAVIRDIERLEAGVEGAGPCVVAGRGRSVVDIANRGHVSSTILSARPIFSIVPGILVLNSTFLLIVLIEVLINRLHDDPTDTPELMMTLTGSTSPVQDTCLEVDH